MVGAVIEALVWFLIGAALAIPIGLCHHRLSRMVKRMRKIDRIWERFGEGTATQVALMRGWGPELARVERRRSAQG